MTTQEIEQRLEQIKARAGDDESAHSLEDQLYEDFIKDIGQGTDSLALRARMVLTSKHIDFERWCA